MLEYIFIRILLMSAVMSAGLTAAYLISRLCEGFMPKKIGRLLWLIPLLSAVIPITVMGIDGYPRAAVTETRQSAVFSPPTQEKYTEDAPIAGDIAEETVPVDGDAQIAGDPATVYKRTVTTDINIIGLTARLYFIGVLAAVMYSAVRSIRIRRRFKALEKAEDRTILEAVMNELGIKRNIELYFINAPVSPFACGIIRPKIVMPRENYTREAVLHELAHIKNGDLPYLLLLHIVKIIHFFDPFIYIFSGAVKNSIELACDEFCAERMDRDGRVRYSRQIIEYSAPAAAGAASLSENGKKIKERVEFIMTYKCKTNAVKITGVCIAAAALLCQSVIAYAVNANAPRAYIINNADEIYSVVYRTADNAYYSKRSGRTSNRAALVNTDVYKGFSADLNVTFGDLNGESDTYDADMTIVMDDFIKSVNDGKVWQGLFTVTINGDTVLDGAKGYLNNVPGNYERDAARLFIEKGDTSIDVEYINFGLGSDSIINAENEIMEKESFEPENRRFLEGVISECVNGISEAGSFGTEDETNNVMMNIFYNTASGDLYADQLQLEGSRYVTTVPGEKYTFSDGSATGKFFLKESGNIILDEFEGTLSGFSNGSRMSMESGDGRLKVTYDKLYDSPNQHYYYRGSMGSNSSDEFIAGSTQHVYSRRLANLPFSLRLNEDKTKVIMTMKDGFEPYGWNYSYASYIYDGNDVYQKGNSKEGGRAVELPLSTSYGTHNLQFRYYNTMPYAQLHSFDILFKIVNGDILYNNAKESIFINSSYYGEAAYNALFSHFLNFYE